MAMLHPSNVAILAHLVATLGALSAVDPWLLFQENYCKTRLMQCLLTKYSFYESSNNHLKYWLVSPNNPWKLVNKPIGTISGEKPDMRIVGPANNVATVELKVRPDFGASAQLGRKYIEGDLDQLCTKSAQIFLLGSSSAWWTKISTLFPNLCPAALQGIPMQTNQSVTLAGGPPHNLKCMAMQDPLTSNVFAAWTIA